jgi:hypothetical protein
MTLRMLCKNLSYGRENLERSSLAMTQATNYTQINFKLTFVCNEIELTTKSTNTKPIEADSWSYWELRMRERQKHLIDFKCKQMKWRGGLKIRFALDDRGNSDISRSTPQQLRLIIQMLILRRTSQLNQQTFPALISSFMLIKLESSH